MDAKPWRYRSIHVPRAIRPFSRKRRPRKRPSPPAGIAGCAGQSI